MSASTKILVLKTKQLVAAGVLILIAIFLLIMLIAISGKNKAQSCSSQKFTPGVYSSSLTLSGSSFDVQVTVDDKNIRSIELINLEDTVKTMYPLISTSLEELKEQIIQSQSTAGITYSQNSRYTCMLLIKGINTALDKASIPTN